MDVLYRTLTADYEAAPDSHKDTPSLAFSCKEEASHLLLGRLIGDRDKEVCVATLYACNKDGKHFIFFRSDNQLQGFVVSAEPMKFVTMSELGYMPEHNASVGIVEKDEQVRWVDSIGPGDGYSYWLAEPRWSETKRWIQERVPT